MKDNNLNVRVREEKTVINREITANSPYFGVRNYDLNNKKICLELVYLDRFKNCMWTGRERFYIGVDQIDDLIEFLQGFKEALKKENMK